jgi:hypothetical protein
MAGRWTSRVPPERSAGVDHQLQRLHVTAAYDAQLEHQVNQLKAVLTVSLVSLAVLLYRQPPRA